MQEVPETWTNTQDRQYESRPTSNPRETKPYTMPCLKPSRGSRHSLETIWLEKTWQDKESAELDVLVFAQLYDRKAKVNIFT